MTSSLRFPKYLAEAAGTFFLVFTGCGAIVVDRLSGGRLTHAGVSLAFGLAVTAMIYAVGHVSGAHLNPAVTAAFWARRRIKTVESAFYVAAQVTGAVAAAAVLSALFPDGDHRLGMTLPTGTAMQSFSLETLLTALLVFVIMAVAVDHRAEGPGAGLAVGAAVTLDALLGGPVSGASMNPARSFGPALLMGDFSHHWIYWAGPLAGALAGAGLHAILRCDAPQNAAGPGCC